MSLELKPQTEIKHYEMDEVEYSKDASQIEDGANTLEEEIPYPDSLKSMPEPPTMEMLREGYALQKSDQDTPGEWQLKCRCDASPI
jgi:hypothetical protein